MTQGDPHEEAGRDEEVAEGEVHDGPLRILVSKCLQVSIESASTERKGQRCGTVTIFYDSGSDF
jgi:hypothetical protein